MTFRRSRRTNDWLGWLTFCACLLGAVIVGGMLAVGVWVGKVETGLGLCFGSLTVMFTVVTGFAGWQLIRPQEWEFVVESGVIRWGRAARPDGQQRVRLADVRQVVNDWREQRVVVETGDGQTVIGDFVLIRKGDQLAFIAFLKQYHSEIVTTNWP